MFFVFPFRRVGMRPAGGTAWRLILAWMFFAFSCQTHAAPNCEGAENIRLSRPVTLDPALRAELGALPPLKVETVDSTPIARYDPRKGTYSGIAIDILCFIADELGLEFELSRLDDGKKVPERVQAVQTGKADVFVPLSFTPARSAKGVFTEPFYASYYAVIARRDANVDIHDIQDLARYRVGYIDGFSFEPTLRAHVPGHQLQAFSQWTTDGLFQSLRKGDIDLAIFSKHVFTEKRYQDRMLDLEIVHVLYDFPRQYRFYFNPAPVYRQLGEVFDMYLDAMDLSLSVMRHQDGERDFLARYLNERDQILLLVLASAAALLLALTALLVLLRHRRLVNRLKEKNIHIERQRQALHQVNQKLETLSHTDALTGLPNRRAFDQKADKAYLDYQGTGSPLSLLIMDIDYFKQINDSYGHSTGDVYLRTIAQALQGVLKGEHQTVARYGGEEFICLLQETGSDTAHAIAEQLRLSVMDLNLASPVSSNACVTISIGIATLTEGDPGVRELYIQADRALYLAKENGRNQVRSAR